MWKFDQLIDNITGYIEARIALAKLDLQQEAAQGIAKAAYLLAAVIALVLFTVFMSLTIAIGLGALFHSYLAGFGFVTLVYGILAYIALTFAKDEKRIEALRTKILQSILAQEAEPVATESPAQTSLEEQTATPTQVEEN